MLTCFWLGSAARTQPSVVAAFYCFGHLPHHLLQSSRLLAVPVHCSHACTAVTTDLHGQASSRLLSTRAGYLDTAKAHPN